MVKIIDIVSSGVDKFSLGKIKAYPGQDRGKIYSKPKSKKIIPFKYDLSIGKFDDNFVYNRGYGYTLKSKKYYFNENLRKIKKQIKKDNNVCIWTSKKGNINGMMFLFLVHYLRNKRVNIYVCETKYPLNNYDESEIDELYKNIRLLDKDKIKKYSNEYKRLVKKNGDIRVLENDTFVSYSFDKLDRETKKYIDKYNNEEISERTLKVRVSGKMLSDNVLNFNTIAPFIVSVERLLNKSWDK